MARTNYSPELKLSIVKKYFERNCTAREFADQNNLSIATLTNWVTKFYKHKRMTNTNLIDVAESVKQMQEIDKNPAEPQENLKFTITTNRFSITIENCSLKDLLEALS